jgi:hypothetical protein
MAGSTFQTNPTETRSLPSERLARDKCLQHEIEGGMLIDTAMPEKMSYVTRTG